jgi:hypothetical protein
MTINNYNARPLSKLLYYILCVNIPQAVPHPTLPTVKTVKSSFVSSATDLL